MFAAMQGRCHHCGRDEGIVDGSLIPFPGSEALLSEGRRYLVVIDTGHPSPEYAREWDVGHWIGGAFNVHIRGKITHIRLEPLPDPFWITSKQTTARPAKEG